MAKNKSSSSKPSGLRPSAVLLMMLLAAAVVAGLAAYIKYTPANSVPVSERKVDSSARQADRRAIENPPAIEGTVLVPRAIVADGTIRFETQTVQVPPGENPKLVAVNAFLKLGGIAESDVKALGVDLREGTARVDFTESFSQTFGSMDEAVLMNGIRATLGQFPDVMRVELFVAGRKIDTLGHLDLIEPQSVIRPADWAPKQTADQPTGQVH